MKSDNYTIAVNGSPCNGCKDRCTSCHSTCEKYAQWKEFVAVIRKERKQYEINWREEYKTLLTV